MNDTELIKETARFWLDHGGDGEGMSWASLKLVEEVKRQEREP